MGVIEASSKRKKNLHQRLSDDHVNSLKQSYERSKPVLHFSCFRLTEPTWKVVENIFRSLSPPFFHPYLCQRK